MSNKGLFFYKLVSKYPEDQTLNCKLSINQIDSNFETLKDADIKSVEFIKEEKVLVVTRNDGEEFNISLKDATYDFNAIRTDNEDKSVSLTISYNGIDGEKTLTIDNIVTVDGLEEVLLEVIEDIQGKVMTRVVTDGTLIGNGTMHQPIGLNRTYKPGTLAPARNVLDLTSGDVLPEIAELGARYLTRENVNDYGYLYNESSLDKITSKLTNGWRIPTKEDWDVLLNSLEPCEYQNHNSNKCHEELGLNAGTFLKSECGWSEQPMCSCSMTSSLPSNEIENNTPNQSGDTPSFPNIPYIGVDKYGMKILPAGNGNVSSHGVVTTRYFGEEAYFWTTTHVYDDPNQDLYVKNFVWNMSGVEQIAECENNYFSVRLVKDYDGSNYFDTEYIDGIVYETVLFPEVNQIWLASNYASKKDLVTTGGTETPEVIDVNDGNINDSKKEYFINEWNGKYWDKRIANEGDTVVIENPPFESAETISREICWEGTDGNEHCLIIDIPITVQKNLEYRIYTDDDCNQILVNTDDLVTERVINAIVPIIGEETRQREETDEELNSFIETEKEERTSGETNIWNAINEEISARTNSDEELWDRLNVEESARTSADLELIEAFENEERIRESADTSLSTSIQDERERAISAETELFSRINSEYNRAKGVEDQIINDLNDEINRSTLMDDEIDGQLLNWEITHKLNAIVSPDSHNLIITTKDNNPEHFINVDFNGNFGEI